MIRRTIHFAGHVQGVGFRFVTRQVASGLAVRGFVRNLADGRVQVIVEGSDADVDSLVEQVRQRMEGYVESVTDERSAATGEFAAFEIRR